MKKHLLLFLPIIFCALLTANATVTLPRLVSNGMVLQRNIKVPVWGWAAPGEKVSVKFHEKTYTTTTGADTKWLIELPKMAAGGPFTMTITGQNQITLTDILIGDVFLCSGQSNMEVAVGNFYAADIAISANPNIRHFKVKHQAGPTPMYDVESDKGWEAASPATLKDFSSVAYFFARDMYAKYGVPIGLLNNSWGGTVAELWISQPGLIDFPNFYHQQYYPLKPENNPTALYNGMVIPVMNYGFKAVLWYQGEFNKSRAFEYRRLFPALIKDWRKNFNKGDFPFVFVQLPNYDPIKTEPGSSELAELREAQAMALSLPNTAMVVTIETNSTTALHPLEKKPIGMRLALAVQKLVYGENIVAAGPTYASFTKNGSAITINFTNIGGGLMPKNGNLNQFTIAGADKKFVKANATISGKTVIVTAPDVADPVAVRYAWADNPVGANLYNKEGLPAAPFRTDDWDGITIKAVGKINIPQPPQVVVTTLANGDYTLQAIQSSLLLTAGDKITQEKALGTKTQVWRFTREGKNAYSILSVGTNQYVTAKDNDYSLSPEKTLYELTDAGNGNYHIRTANKGVYFDITANSKEPGALMHLWGMGSGDNQKFRIVAAQ